MIQFELPAANVIVPPYLKSAECLRRCVGGFILAAVGIDWPANAANQAQVSGSFETVMQYFGYLRRDPNAYYLNWIQELDTTGNSRNLINGFVNSLEYRFRFGS